MLFSRLDAENRTEAIGEEMYMEQTLHIEIKLLYELAVKDLKAKQHHSWSYS